MYIPKNFKFKKQQKGKDFAKINSQSLTIFNPPKFIGLKSIDFGRISSQQLKSLKQVVTKCIKKTGRLRFKIFPQTPITKKPIEVRMGKGKGNVDHWVVKIKPGTMLCFIETNLIAVAKKALKYAQIRLPIKTKIILTN